MKKRLLTFSIVALLGAMVSCGGSDSSSVSSGISSSSAVSSGISSAVSTGAPSVSSVVTETKFAIVGYESTEVLSGTTLDLTVQMTPAATNPNYIWESSDENIATVSTEGKVSFYNGGEVSIRVKVASDASKTDEVTFQVSDDQTSLTLDRFSSARDLSDRYETKDLLYCGRTVRLTGAKALETGFASFNEGGTVAFDVGSYSVKSVTATFEGAMRMDYGFRATSERETLLESGVKMETKGNHFALTAVAETDLVSVVIEYGESHEGILSSFWGSESYDLSQMATSDNPVVTVNPNNFQNAIFNDVRGRYYVAEATIDLPYKSGNWNGFSLGHLNATDGTTFRGLLIDANRQAIVTPTISTPDVNWGDETDRSQIWGQHKVGSFDYENLRLTTVRNDTDYYYFIDGELYWKDTAGTALDDVDTYPAMHYRSCDVTIGDLAIFVGQNKVESYLENHAAAEKTLYASDETNVEIGDDCKTIRFKNANHEDASLRAPTNVKDNAAKSIGDAMLLKSDKDYDIEFDLTIDAWGNTDGTPAVVVTTRRRTNGPAEARSWEFGEYKAGFAGWNYNGDLPAGIGSGGQNYTSALEEGETVHVVLHKTNIDGGSDFSFECKGADHNWNWNGNYAGDLTLEFATRNADATLTNIRVIEK